MLLYRTTILETPKTNGLQKNYKPITKMKSV